jgi:UDP:flavonoid glycosyltransferase YjiC (YdhE family)
VRELEFTQTLPRAVRFIGPVLATPIRDPGSRVQLDRIRPNILVTIGTHLNYARAALRRNIRQWAAACPEFHFHYSAGGNDGLAELESGPNWRGYAYINYEQELPAFAAVIHHAGAGITYHCLSAGLPAVVLPHDYDQFDFAARLEHHGLARRSRRPAGVVPLLREITTDAALRSRLERFRAIVHRHNPGEEVQRLLQETALGPALGQPS